MLYSLFEVVVLTVYLVSLTFIVVYSLGQLHLVYLFFRHRKHMLPEPSLTGDDVPFVTIQLPIYNELYVVERLLEACASQDYPKDRFEIQLLDDSNDETVSLAASKLKELELRGFLVSHVRRPERTGFKAGALAYGLDVAKGDFVAIFDADFLPRADYLRTAMAQFTEPEIGVVQARWEHINRSYSVFTEMQAFHLDAHFTVEQLGRNAGGMCINFNGTAGIWRKQCIIDAGNWEGDTLTEDLDLSYRAQLKNWKFKYLENVETPAELPIAISAARSQQFRWNKGGAENFKKMLWKVLKNKNISAKTKVHGLLHLLNSTMFLNILIVAVLSIPMLYIKNEYTHLKAYFLVMSFFVISTLIFFVCYWIMYRKMYGGGIKNFMNYIGMFFVFFSIAMGFSLHNSIAVLEGHLGKKSDFVRTPKFNINTIKDSWKNNKYLKKTVSIHVIFEGLLMLYFAFGMYSAFVVGDHGGDFGLFPFHLMLFLGFGYVFFKSLTSKV